MSKAREKNIALAKEIAKDDNFCLVHIIHLATLAAHCGGDSMEDFCDRIRRKKAEKLAKHRQPHVREFYQRLAQLVEEAGFMYSVHFQQIRDIIRDTGTCGFLVKAAHLRKDAWGYGETRYFYGETYSKTLQAARAWAESEVEEDGRD